MLLGSAGSVRKRVGDDPPSGNALPLRPLGSCAGLKPGFSGWLIRLLSLPVSSEIHRPFNAGKGGVDATPIINPQLWPRLPTADGTRKFFRCSTPGRYVPRFCSKCASPWFYDGSGARSTVGS